MKKLSLSLVALIAMAICAQAVNSVNIVGVNSVQLEPGKRVILATQLYDPQGDGTNTLLNVFGTDQLVQNANYIFADQVIVFDTVSAVYQAYAQYTDGNFYKCNSVAEWNASILANDDVLPVGGACWVVHPASEAASEIALTGEVLGAASHTQDVAVVTGYQLASYPYAQEKPIQDLVDIADGATAHANYIFADRIVTWDSDAQAYQAYGLYTDDIWYKCNDVTEWNASIAATASVALGEGFWYIAQGGFTLTEACPYSAAYSN
jgi:hypothetical protein